MKNFSTILKSLLQTASVFNEDANSKKETLLKTLNRLPLPAANRLLAYHDLLLFFVAYPGNERILQLAEKELKRITAFAKKNGDQLPYNEGMPFTYILTRFSPDFLDWLVKHEDIKVEFDSFYKPGLLLNDVLNVTLPTLFKAETSASSDNVELLERFGIKPAEYIPFILGQLEELNNQPLLKELFKEKISAYVKLHPKNEKFSKAYSRMAVSEIFYHQELLKNFDAKKTIESPLPGFRLPSESEKAALYKNIRNAMALNVREIDPATFMQPDSIRLYDVGRGLVFCTYSMLPDRQLPLETFFGFTFYKNGIPVSYGGVWTFGKLARIGLNIFGPYRSGESGFLLYQIIRVFSQQMGSSYFEIEPYQFGLDNPDGIKSGAFWFYYKFGYRPVNKELRKLADDEYNRIKTRKNYRCPEKTLLKFTESNIFLSLTNERKPLDLLDVNNKVLATIKKRWHNNYKAARALAVEEFCKKVSLSTQGLTNVEKNTLEEVSLWAMAYKITSPRQLQLMKQMISAKTKDDYAYQQLLLEFFKDKS